MMSATIGSFDFDTLGSCEYTAAVAETDTCDEGSVFAALPVALLLSLLLWMGMGWGIYRLF